MRTLKVYIKIIASILLFLSSCDGFEKDINAYFAKYPPKLAVTAILDRNGDSGESAFTITICEGRSLADYIEGVPVKRTIKAQGRITLFENDIEVFTHSGEFDMSTEGQSGWMWTEEGMFEITAKRGYRYERSGFVTHAGRSYRLVVDVDGYPAVTSVAVMPALPAISATADTTALVNVKWVQRFGSLDSGYGGYVDDGSETEFFTVTLHLDERSSTSNYYALEMFENGETGSVCINDLKKFPDNPDIEYYNEVSGIFDDTDINSDMYAFLLFLLNDNNFPRDHASLNLYSEFRPAWAIPSGMTTSLSPYGNIGLISQQYVLSLRVRHITAETFRYYRSLALQNVGMGFFTEPVNIAGNIEGGFGVFSVYNSKDIILLDYERYLLRGVTPEN